MKIDVTVDRQILANALLEILKECDLGKAKESLQEKTENGLLNHNDHEAVWCINVLEQACYDALDINV